MPTVIEEDYPIWMWNEDELTGRRAYIIGGPKRNDPPHVNDFYVNGVYKKELKYKNMSNIEKKDTSQNATNESDCRAKNNFAGLTSQEQEVLEKLIDTWNSFVDLPVYDPNHLVDMRQYIDNARRIVQERVAYRTNPEFFNKK